MDFLCDFRITQSEPEPFLHESLLSPYLSPATRALKQAAVARFLNSYRFWMQKPIKDSGNIARGESVHVGLQEEITYRPYAL